MDFSSYITGFIDGEGCFSVSFMKRSKMKSGIEIRPSFSVSQHKRNLPLVKKIHGFFGVGGIRFSKRDQNYKYEVRSLKDLTSVIIPHFEKYPLMTSKRSDFDKFVLICALMKQNKHLNKKYLLQIIDLAYEMNGSGKRRYKKKELLKSVIR